MILRLFILLTVCACLSGTGNAVPILPLHPSSSVQTVQNRDEKRDVWHSPQNSLENFPLLGQQDCARYGRKNGYSECESGPSEKPESVAEETIEPPAAQPELVAPAVPLQVPLPVRRTKVVDGKAASPAGSAGTTSEQSSVVAASPEDHFAKTVGALLVVTFEGRSTAEAGPKRVASVLRQGRIGGVLLRRANIASPDQLKALTAFLAEGQSRAPLILIEQSGGSDNTLTRTAGFDPAPSPREIGARGDALQAFDTYQQIARRLAAAGVTLNIGPNATACPEDASGAMADCFGGDPRHSAAFATAFNLAHQSQGVLTAMRFQSSPRGDDALSEMAKRKGPDALVVSAQAANVPPGTATSTLRPSDYSGAILFESVDRQAAAEKLVDALNRGADMVLFRTALGLEAGLSDAALADVRSAVDTGRLDRARLDDAVAHAASLRQQLQALRSRMVSGPGAGQNSQPR
jgi:hypothetical protein